MSKKIGALIPIRLASERLPNKAIRQICGRPVVWHLLDRVCASKYLNKSDVVVCTTQEKSDDSLMQTVKEYGCSAFRGSTDDIIKRFYDAIEYHDFDAVIQVDGDDVLCDTRYMDLTMDKLIGEPKLDIVMCEGLPLGIASKSFTRKAIERVYERYQTQKNDTGFTYFFTKTGLCEQGIIHPQSQDHILDEARLTLDYKEDLEVFTDIFNSLYREGEVFGLAEVIKFLREHPEVAQKNLHLNKEFWHRTKEKARLAYKNSKGLVQMISWDIK